MNRPGFTVRRVDVAEDVIELPENIEADPELAELLDLLDETAGELRKVREARDVLFEETRTLRDELVDTRVEIQNLRFAAAFPELAETAAADSELEPLRETLRNLDRWIQTGPEYCPICRAQFSRLETHADDCPFANLGG